MRLKLFLAASLLASAGAAWYLLSRPAIAFVGFTDQLSILAGKASARAAIPIAEIGRETLENGAKTPNFGAYKVVFLNGLRAEPYPEQVRNAVQTAVNKGTKVIVLPPRQAKIMALGNADFEGADANVAGYFSNGGVENWARLLRFVSTTYNGAKLPIDPPVETPDDGFYHPDSEDIFTSVEAYSAFLNKTGKAKAGAPKVVLDFSQGWKTGITQGTDGLIRAYEKRGWVVYPLFGQKHAEYLPAIQPDLIVNRAHGRFFQGDRGVKLLNTVVQAPVIRGLTLTFEQKTIEDYQQSTAGIRGPGLSIGTIVSELDGTIEPTLVEGLRKDANGRKIEVPLDERIQRLIDRSDRWVKLRRTANKDKRIAVVYFAAQGKGEFTAAGLNVPRSLVKFLNGMKHAGYTVDNIPADGEALFRLLNERESKTTPIPAASYAKWFASLPEKMKSQLTEAYGPPPETLSVPTLTFGNVTLVPQPARGANMDSKLAHSDKVPPPHEYLATYFWLQDGLKADALVHYGTHGTYEFLPGRPVGQLDDDYSDRTVAALPNVYVYTMDNVGEALMAKRRGNAVMVSHQTPPIEPAQLSESDAEVRELYRLTQQFTAQDEGALKQQMRAKVRELAVRRKLDQDLRLDWKAAEPTNEQIAQLDRYLDDLDEAKIPIGLHVHSTAYGAKELGLTVTEILGKPFVERAAGRGKLEGEAYRAAKIKAAETIRSRWNQPTLRPAVLVKPAPEKVYAVASASMAAGKKHPGTHGPASPAGEVMMRPQPNTELARRPTDGALDADFARLVTLKAAFAETANEIPATLRALDGKYIQPGGGGDPVRSPQALPTGRNLYGVNPREIPTKAAWELGIKLANDLIGLEQKRLGRLPKKVGFNLWPTELIRQYGTDLASIFWLLGVRPVWDQRGIVVDLELIPAAELKRPRIDVLIMAAGQFRDSFPDRMELIDQAVRLAATARDAENYVAANAAALETELKQQGLSAADAKQFSLARVFSNGVGGYGSGITGGVMKSGAYTDTKELTEAYVERMGAVYTAGAEWGKKVPKLYESALKNTEAISISNSSNTISALTLDHYFEFAGGMAMALRDKHGQSAGTYIADTRDAEKTRTITVEEALAQDFRAKMWNPKWIEGMKAQDFAGASEVSTLTQNLYGWQTTRPETIKDYFWQETYKIYVDDPKMRQWFDEKNAFAFQNMTAAMLEAIRKGYWKADAATRQNLSTLYAASVTRRGASGSERTAGNAGLQKFVADNLNAPGNVQGQLLSQFQQAAKAPAVVTGQKLVVQKDSPLAAVTPRNSLYAMAGLAAVAALFWFGIRRKKA
jgi:cobaltochelatase CobN